MLGGFGFSVSLSSQEEEDIEERDCPTNSYSGNEFTYFFNTQSKISSRAVKIKVTVDSSRYQLVGVDSKLKVVERQRGYYLEDVEEDASVAINSPVCWYTNGDHTIERVAGVTVDIGNYSVVSVPDEPLFTGVEAVGDLVFPICEDATFVTFWCRNYAVPIVDGNITQMATAEVGDDTWVLCSTTSTADITVKAGQAIFDIRGYAQVVDLSLYVSDIVYFIPE
jgi:hypothetical protein